LRGAEVKPHLVIESGYAVGFEGFTVDLQDTGTRLWRKSRRGDLD
jgi:hypothetical protein